MSLRKLGYAATLTLALSGSQVNAQDNALYNWEMAQPEGEVYQTVGDERDKIHSYSEYQKWAPYFPLVDNVDAPIVTKPSSNTIESKAPLESSLGKFVRNYSSQLMAGLSTIIAGGVGLLLCDFSNQRLGRREDLDGILESQ